MQEQDNETVNEHQDLVAIRSYSQSFAFRQFFSNFLAYSQQRNIRRVFIAPENFNVSSAFFVAAFAYHTARLLGERVLIIENEQQTAEERALIVPVLGTHKALRNSLAGEVDVLPFDYLRKDELVSVQAGNLDQALEYVCQEFGLSIFMGTGVPTSPENELFIQCSDLRFLLCRSDSLTRGQTKRHLNEFKKSRITFDACVVLSFDSDKRGSL